MKSKLILGAILISHIFILSELIFFPYPELFVYPYLTNHGLKPYSQILDQHFPGLMFLPINFDNLGMNSPEVARIWLMAVVVLTHVLIFVISAKILKSEKKAILVNLLYLIWQPYFEGWVLWIDNFLPLFLLPAFYFTYQFSEKKLLKDVFFVGLFFGLGIIFKQVLIPFAGLIFLNLFWIRKDWKTFIYFILGILPPIFVMIIYLFSIGVLNDFWYWTITYNLTVFNEYGKKLPFFTGLIRVGFVLLVSLLVWFSKDRKLAQILTFFSFASLLTIYARFDFVHFQPALPFVTLATVVGFVTILKRWRLKVLVSFFLYSFVIVWWQIIFYKGHISDKVFFFDEQTRAIASKIEENINPGDKIFIFGAIPHLYQITKTLPAGDIFVFQFPWFIRVTEDRIVEGLKRDNPRIIVSDRTVEIEGQRIVEYANKIDQFIQSRYEPVAQIGDTFVLKKINP